jgi:hypothetical protein
MAVRVVASSNQDCVLRKGGLFHLMVFWQSITHFRHIIATRLLENVEK